MGIEARVFVIIVNITTHYTSLLPSHARNAPRKAQVYARHRLRTAGTHGRSGAAGNPRTAPPATQRAGSLRKCARTHGVLSPTRTRVAPYAYVYVRPAATHTIGVGAQIVSHFTNSKMKV